MNILGMKVSLGVQFCLLLISPFYTSLLNHTCNLINDHQVQMTDFVPDLAQSGKQAGTLEWRGLIMLTMSKTTMCTS